MKSSFSTSYISSIINLDSNQEVQKISNEKKITSLWAGYGTINAIDITISPNNKKKSIIIKRVNPPTNDNSISNQRKIKSYHVEGFFYNTLAPLLIDITTIDASIPCQIATPYSIEIKSSSSFTFILEDLSENYNESYSSSLSSMDQSKQAIQWLSVFHVAFFNHRNVIHDTLNNTQQIWKYGGYWHLQTRQDEWDSIPSYQCYFQKSAHAIDKRMNEIGNGKSHTLIHGDFKDANVLFGSNNLGHCAVVDFQYTGVGYGAKDLVMWVVSSMSSKTFEKLGGEEGILQMYHDALCENAKKICKLKKVEWVEDDWRQFLNLNNIKMQYELALVDYVRFMVGWGLWGSNVGYAERRAVEILIEISGSQENLKKYNSAEWERAIYDRYPLELF